MSTPPPAFARAIVLTTVPGLGIESFRTTRVNCYSVLATARSQKRPTKATGLIIIATAAATGRTLRTLDDAQASLARLVGVPVNP
jgi:hypothetical protein